MIYYLLRDSSPYSGCIVEVKMIFFDTFTMVAFRVRQPEQSFSQKIILLIPKGAGNVQESMSVRYASNAVLSPAKRSRSGMFMGEVYHCEGSQQRHLSLKQLHRGLRLHASPFSLVEKVSMGCTSTVVPLTSSPP